MKKFFSLLSLAALASGLLVSCDIWPKGPYFSHVTSVALDRTELEITIGDPDVQLVATVLPQDATDTTVIWASDKTEFATVDQQGNVHAVAKGTAIITVTTNDRGKTAACTVTVKDAEPEYVRMGLYYWATKNLGATTVAGSLATCAGDYYQWGSLNTLYNSIPWGTWSGTGDIAITSWKNGKEDGFVRGNREYTTVDGNNLPDANDVVRQKLGGGWRMPKSSDFQNLFFACGVMYMGGATPSTLTSSTPGQGVYWLPADQAYLSAYTGVAGLLFCDNNGSKLFFPAASQAGFGTGYTSLKDPSNSGGYYWTINYSDDDGTGNYAVSLCFNVGTIQSGDQSDNVGLSIRPVKDLTVPPGI